MITQISRKEYKSWSFSLWNFLQSPVISFLLILNIFLSTLVSNTLITCSSTNVRNWRICMKFGIYQKDTVEFMFWANLFPKCGMNVSIAVCAIGYFCWHMSSRLPTSQECQRWKPPLPGYSLQSSRVEKYCGWFGDTVNLFYFYFWKGGVCQNVAIAFAMYVCLSVCQWKFRNGRIIIHKI